MKPTLILGSIVGIFVVAAIVIGGWVASYSFDTDVGDHLKRAADAPNLEMAAEAMDIAIANAADRNLTSGNSAVFFKKPRHDVGYWYRQLVEARSELDVAIEEGTVLAESNGLMKLREVLMDGGEYGDQLTLPVNIEYSPNIYFWGLGRWLIVGVVVIWWAITLCVLGEVGS